MLAAYLVGTLVFFPITLLLGATALVFPAPIAIVYCLVGALSARVDDLRHRTAGRTLSPALAAAPAPDAGQAASFAAAACCAVIAARMLPVGNFSLINITAGAFGVRFRDYLIGNAIGLLPGVLALTVFADRIGATRPAAARAQPDRAGRGRRRHRPRAVVAQAPHREAEVTARPGRLRVAPTTFTSASAATAGAIRRASRPCCARSTPT